MFDLKEIVDVEISIKDGTAAFAEQLTNHIYVACQGAAQTYLNIALHHVHRSTGQLADSGQIHLVKSNDSRNFSVPSFEFQVSFGREEGSLTQSRVWEQTYDQQKKLGRAPQETDARAWATEVGFYAWEKPKRKNWRRMPYLYQGLPFIKPAFVELMKDWDYTIDVSEMSRSFLGLGSLGLDT